MLVGKTNFLRACSRRKGGKGDGRIVKFLIKWHDQTIPNTEKGLDSVDGQKKTRGKNQRFMQTHKHRHKLPHLNRKPISNVTLVLIFFFWRLFVFFLIHCTIPCQNRIISCEVYTHSLNLNSTAPRARGAVHRGRPSVGRRSEESNPRNRKFTGNGIVTNNKK